MGNENDAWDDLQLVAFRIGEASFALEIHNVQEIVRVQPSTRVPNTPKHVEGVINLRGTVLPVLNLHKLFGIEEQNFNEDSRMIVVKVEGISYGILVEQASEVLRMPGTALEAAPEVAAKNHREYVLGVVKSHGNLWVLLDPLILSLFFRQKTGA